MLEPTSIYVWACAIAFGVACVIARGLWLWNKPMRDLRKTLEKMERIKREKGVPWWL